MTNKYFRILLSLGVVLCLICVSFTVSMAAPDETEATETKVTESTDETHKTENDEDEDPSQTVIVIPNTTKKVTKPPETTKEETNAAQTVNKNNKTTKTETTERETAEERENEENEDEDSTEEGTTLPEGSFYVYLELNNGQERRKTVLDKPGLVPEPNDPTRAGYIFDGWYADAECTKPWDFTKSVADENTVIYARWVADPNTVVYNITVADLDGGSIEVNPSSASAGEPIIITVRPTKGKRLVFGSITINGKSSNVLSFIMPAEDVVVSASFEDIPEEAETDDGISVVPFIIGGIFLVFVALVITVIIIKYRSRPSVIEYDENGAIILDDDDDDGWVDDSIVIEDGFADGKITHENVEPDFGLSDTDELI